MQLQPPTCCFVKVGSDLATSALVRSFGPVSIWKNHSPSSVFQFLTRAVRASKVFPPAPLCSSQWKTLTFFYTSLHVVQLPPHAQPHGWPGLE